MGSMQGEMINANPSINPNEIFNPSSAIIFYLMMKSNLNNINAILNFLLLRKVGPWPNLHLAKKLRMACITLQHNKLISIQMHLISMTQIQNE